MTRRTGNRSPSKRNSESQTSADSRENSVIFGVMPVLESLRASAGKLIEVAVSDSRHDERTSEIIELAKSNGIPFRIVKKDEFKNLVPEGANDQGVAALVKPFEYRDAEYLIRKAENDSSSLLLLLDGIEDPRNLGAILRTAECANVTGVFIPAHRSAEVNDTAIKVSAGGASFVDVAKVKNLNRLIEELKSRNIWVVGASGEADMNYSSWDFCQPTALVLGGEGGGIRRLTAEKCDTLVKLPMYGRIGSLNVSVAAGVLIYESLRQKRKESA